MSLYKLFNYFLITILVISVSCIRFTELQFDKENLFNAKSDSTKSSVELAKSIPIMEYNNGIIADFNSGVKSNWWGASKIRLSSKGGAMLIDASGVGISYDRFGHWLSTFCDFSKANIIRVRARSEGKSVPLLRIDLKDANGFTTNHVDTKTRILINDNFTDYYFRYEGKFEQGWPSRHVVDITKISELEIFVNPGGENYTGRIIIDEIVVVESIENSNVQNVTSVNLEKNEAIDMKYWWSNSPKYSLVFDKDEKGIRIISRGNGERYESFGRGFESTNLSENPVIRIKAKSDGKIAPDFRVDLVDVNGNATNGVAITKTIPNDNTYRDYYFDFNNKLYQGWPQTIKVDAQKISELMFFLNPGQMNFVGDITISEIEIVKDYKGSSDESKEYKEKDSIIIDLNSNWWTNEGFELSSSDSELSIISNKEEDSKIKLGLGFNLEDLSSIDELVLTTNFIDSTMKVKFYDYMGNASNVISLDSIISNNNSLSVLKFSISNSNNKFDNSKVSGLVLYFSSSSKTLVGESKLSFTEVKFVKNKNN